MPTVNSHSTMDPSFNNGQKQSFTSPLLDAATPRVPTPSHSKEEYCDDAKELDVLVTRMKDMLVDYMEQSRQPDGLLIDYREPEELESIMDFDLPDQGVGVEGIFPTIMQTLQYSVNTFSPRFMDKLYAGSSPIGVLAELLLAGLNGNSHVYHVSPVLTLMEIHATRAMANLFGFQGPRAGGLSCPGGSASNLLAMVTARNSLYPEIKSLGYFPKFVANIPVYPTTTEAPSPSSPSTSSNSASTTSLPTISTKQVIRNEDSRYGKLIAFTSSDGHYSLEKAAVIMGMGADNIIGVPCDSNGAMIAEELERLIQEHIAKGHTPFFINVTAGTTVLGAFDPIEACNRIAKQYNCWMHIDGSWGGSVVFLPRLAKTLLKGSETADSITINPHKMLHTSQQCSLLLVPDTSIFPTANALNANYLFHGQSHDLGDGTLGCGRRPDAVKLFLSWKFYGKDGYTQRIEKSFQNVEKFLSILKRDHFHGGRIQMLPLGETASGKDKPELLQVCFWYRPQGSRLVDWRGTEAAYYHNQSSAKDNNNGSSEINTNNTTTNIQAVSDLDVLVPPSPMARYPISPWDMSLASSTTATSPASSTVSLMSSTSTAPSEEDEQKPTAPGVIFTDAAQQLEAKQWMEAVTKRIHNRIRVRGGFMIDYAPLGSYLPVFFRVVLNPPTIRDLDLEGLLKEILDCGERISNKVPIPECCREV